MKSAVALVCLVALAAVACGREWTVNDSHRHGKIFPTNSPALNGLCDSVQQESGYFTVGGQAKDKNYFYWYFESRSSPSTDPVVLWMTGGPGCSSELATLFENGPCTVNPDGETTTLNPYSWNSRANLIYIDQPAGVGFSWGDEGDHNEAEVAEDMNQFLHEFFDAHSELAGRELFIFGESYGGHFAPATAARVGRSLNLTGLGVGNGLTDPLVQYGYYGEMAYTYAKQKLGKPVISELAYNAMKAEWPKCQSMISDCQKDTAKCGGAEEFCNAVMMGPYQRTGRNVYDIRVPCGPYPLCYNVTAIETFLNLESTKAALGVKAGLTWESCNMDVNQKFTNDWMKDFQQDVTALLANNTRVMIYAGDVDFICNWIGNKQWTLSLDWPGNAGFNAAADAPWSVNGAVAGEVRTYDSFSFVRVFNAGHMVPHDQPQAALAMLDKFIATGF